MRGFVMLAMSLGAALLVGCEDEGLSAEEREERDPNVINARELYQDKQYVDAIAAYKKAIESDATMARPHLDMALTYQRLIENARTAGGQAEEFVDYHIHSIYHFDRYLELRPEAEKAEFIAEQKQKVVESLAVFLIQRAPKVQELAKERNHLMEERVELKRQLAAALQKAESAASSGQTVTQAVPKSAAPKVTAPPTERPKQVVTQPSRPPLKATHEIYHVVSGDNLYKIANQFYGDSSKWDIIFEANKDTLRSPSSLKVGQTLVIPILGN